jgi:hypothetical protein
VLQAVRQQIVLEDAHLTAQRLYLQRVPDTCHQPAFLDRLDEIVESAFLHAQHRGLDILSGSHDDDRQLRVEADDLR